MGALFSNPLFLKILSLVILPAAIATKGIASPNTIAHKVADYLIQILVGVGVYSSIPATGIGSDSNPKGSTPVVSAGDPSYRPPA
jgi:hypothetical protein